MILETSSFRLLKTDVVTLHKTMVAQATLRGVGLPPSDYALGRVCAAKEVLSLEFRRELGSSGSTRSMQLVLYSGVQHTFLLEGIALREASLYAQCKTLPFVTGTGKRIDQEASTKSITTSLC